MKPEDTSEESNDSYDLWLSANSEEVAKHVGKVVAVHPIRGIVASTSSIKDTTAEVTRMGLFDEVVIHVVS